MSEVETSGSGYVGCGDIWGIATQHPPCFEQVGTPAPQGRPPPHTVRLFLLTFK